MTGALTDTQLRDLVAAASALHQLAERKAAVLKALQVCGCVSGALGWGWGWGWGWPIRLRVGLHRLILDQGLPPS